MQTQNANFDHDYKSNDIIEQAKSEVLKTVAYALLRQAYGVDEPQKPNVNREQINFFEEVRKFEVNLIRQALLYANGKKAGAARLLNLNATTLHSKLKLYSIDAPLDTAAIEHSTGNGFGDNGDTLIETYNEPESLAPIVSDSYLNVDDAFADTAPVVSDLETLKTEVIRSIARVLEFKASSNSAAINFDGQRGVNFYDEVMKFEIELICQAISRANGNQRAAARMLSLKTTTLYSKVKLYKLNINFIAA